MQWSQHSKLVLHSGSNSRLIKKRETSKGQLISQGLFGVIVLTKKPTKYF